MASGVDDEMTRALTIDEQTREWTRWLEHSRARRDATTIPHARRSLARSLQVSPGTIERLRTGRVKGVRQWLFDRVRCLVVREIESEIQRLSHDLELARRCDRSTRGVEVEEIETHLAAVRRLLT